MNWTAAVLGLAGMGAAFALGLVASPTVMGDPRAQVRPDFAETLQLTLDLEHRVSNLEGRVHVIEMVCGIDGGIPRTTVE